MYSAPYMYSTPTVYHCWLTRYNKRYVAFEVLRLYTLVQYARTINSLPLIQCCKNPPFCFMSNYPNTFSLIYR